MTDEGSILFPSITICKDQMYNKEEQGIMSKLQSEDLSVEEARAWFEARTVSRSRLVKFLRVRTVEGSNDYPCNTVSGPRNGPGYLLTLSSLWELSSLGKCQ